jgi:hypothetical protein
MEADWPLFMVMYENWAWGHQRSWVLVDTNEMLHIIVGSYPTPDFRTPVSQWWPALKDYIYHGTPVPDETEQLLLATDETLSNHSEICPQFALLRELFLHISKKPNLDTYDSGMRDGGGVSCYGIFGEETWLLEEHGSLSTINTDSAINEFLDVVYEHVFHNHINHLYFHHHPVLKCDKGHPLAKLSQKGLVEAHFGLHYKTGYRCNVCLTSETHTDSLHCRQCGYDLCPTCTTKRLS